MTPEHIAAIAGKLTKAQKQDIKDAVFITGDYVLIGEDDEDLSEDIADCVSGILTPLGLAVRRHLQEIDCG